MRQFYNTYSVYTVYALWSDASSLMCVFFFVFLLWRHNIVTMFANRFCCCCCFVFCSSNKNKVLNWIYIYHLTNIAYAFVLELSEKTMWLKSTFCSHFHIREPPFRVYQPMDVWVCDVWCVCLFGHEVNKKKKNNRNNVYRPNYTLILH